MEWAMGSILVMVVMVTGLMGGREPTTDFRIDAHCQGIEEGDEEYQGMRADGEHFERDEDDGSDGCCWWENWWWW